MRTSSTRSWTVLLLVAMTLSSCNHTAPFPTRVVSMQYPRLAAVARITGTAVIRVRIDTTGKVISATGLSGHPLLIESAVANIQLWTFAAPQRRVGKAEPGFDFTYVFELKGESDTSRPCSAVTYQYPSKVTVVSEEPHWEP